MSFALMAAFVLTGNVEEADSGWRLIKFDSTTTLTVYLRLHGQSPDWAEVQSRLRSLGENPSLAQLKVVAASYHCDSMVLRPSLGKLSDITLPALIFIADEVNNERSFGLLLEVTAERVLLLRGDCTLIYMSLDEFARIWSGHAMVLSSQSGDISALVWLIGFASLSCIGWKIRAWRRFPFYGDVTRSSVLCAPKDPESNT